MEHIGSPFTCEAVPAPGVGNFVLGTPMPWKVAVVPLVSQRMLRLPHAGHVHCERYDRAEWGYGTLTATGLSRDTVLWTSAGSTANINFATWPVYVYWESPRSALSIATRQPDG